MSADHGLNLIVISDLHCGCKFGLCPPRVRLDEGGSYEHSRLQAVVWGLWQRFWQVWVPHVTRGGLTDVVVNGDCLDGVHHRSTTQITHNIKDQRNIAYEVLAPVADNCHRFYMIRGTEAHVGASAENEEAVAELLGAYQSELGNYSHNELWVKLGPGLVHLLHHIGTTGSAAYETTAILKELVESYTEAGRNRLDPPDVVVRSHRHRHAEVRVPTKLGYGISFTTPGWQLKTPFVYRIPGARVTTPQIGGSLIRWGDEDLYTRHRVWSMDRPTPVVVEVGDD